MKKYALRLLLALGILALIIGILPPGKNISYASDLELIGTDLGLVIEPKSTKLFDLTNMIPGDSREAKLTIRNQYEEAFQLFMSTERVSELPEEGDVDLLEQLEATVYLDRAEIYKGSLKGFASDRIDLGKFQTGDKKELKTLLHLPGPETGNEFQGKSAEVKWKFIAQADQILSEEDPKEEDPGDKKPGKVDSGRILPKTGEEANSFYIMLGLILLVLGIVTMFKKKVAK